MPHSIGSSEKDGPSWWRSIWTIAPSSCVRSFFVVPVSRSLSASASSSRTSWQCVPPPVSSRGSSSFIRSKRGATCSSTTCIRPACSASSCSPAWRCDHCSIACTSISRAWPGTSTCSCEKLGSTTPSSALSTSASAGCAVLRSRHCSTASRSIRFAPLGTSTAHCSSCGSLGGSSTFFLPNAESSDELRNCATRPPSCSASTGSSKISSLRSMSPCCCSYAMCFCSQSLAAIWPSARRPFIPDS